MISNGSTTFKIPVKPSTNEIQLHKYARILYLDKYYNADKYINIHSVWLVAGIEYIEIG